ncbi:MAG: WecB/TagA/CpsF family glycosyltransferase [Planctomycetes bacterium]|nr:WecB/TagA/CpsF family glycosyltransferase [Planctomycetota bacterium]
MPTNNATIAPLSTPAAATRRVCLFDMPLNALTFQEALDQLITLAQGDRTAYVVTANVDHVVRYHRDPSVRSLYTQADMVLADGMPLVWASRLLGKPLPERVAGSDLFPALCARAAEAEVPVFFLGGAPGTAERCAAILTERHPRLRVVGTHCPDFGFERDSERCSHIADMVRASGARILFVGLGAPKQENFIVAHREACGAKLSIGIGISFSFVCGDVVRAPRWLQRIGLEWLHRLVQEPGRLWRRYLIEDAAFARLVLREWWSRKRSPAAK